MDIQDILSIPLLGCLGEAVIRRELAGGGFKRQQYKKGRLIHGEGDACGRLEIILSGQVAVERVSQEGDLMTIAAFHQGDCVGGNLLFSSRPVYRLAVSAHQPTRILEMSRQAAFRLFQENSVFLARYLAYVADNAGLLEDKLTHFTNLPIRARLLNFLKAEQKKQGSRHILLPTSKKALAAQFGVQRTSLSRELQKMRAEGLVTFDRPTITLL